MIDLLTEVWQRVLRRPLIGVEDDFFEIGGDPSLARDLFAEINLACGRDLSPAMICQAPTIATLAAVLEQPASTRLSPLVLLKAGTEKEPVFLTYGIGGSIVDFIPLARHISTTRPIYGIEAKGVDGASEPLQRVEDMAEFNLHAIRQIQVHGPYLLVGYSLGGLVMLEMAQRLSEAGEKVGLLVMLDSYPHIRHLHLAPRIRLMAGRAIRRVADMRQVLMRDSIFEIICQRKQRRQIVKDRGDSTNGPPSTSLSFALAAELVRDNAVLALGCYRPRFYSGKINFVRAETPSYFPQDPAAVWGHLAAELEVETAPGDHVGMVATRFDAVASMLGRYLTDASFQTEPTSAVLIAEQSRFGKRDKTLPQRN